MLWKYHMKRLLSNSAYAFLLNRDNILESVKAEEILKDEEIKVETYIVHFLKWAVKRFFI